MANVKAGRELDAMVHSKVMGIVWDEKRCRVCGWPLAKTMDDGCVAISCSMRPPPDRRADEPPSYSETISAAWQVVEAMAKDGWKFHLQWNGTGKQNVFGVAAEVSFQHMKKVAGHSAFADTAPLAIVTAALRAKGVEV